MTQYDECKIAWKNLFISSNGDIRICTNMNAIGNISQMDIQSIWRSPQAQQIRLKIKNCQKECKILNCNFDD